MEKFDIVFLDIDGVVATENAHDQAIADWCGDDFDTDDIDWRHKFCEITKELGFWPDFNMEKWPFERFAMRNIHALSRFKDVRFVISSDWRRGRSIQELTELFGIKGLSIRIIGKTRETEGRDDPRGQQIKDWLDANSEIVNNFVILDDNVFDILRFFPKNTIATRPDVGFSEANLTQALLILKK